MWLLPWSDGGGGGWEGHGLTGPIPRFRTRAHHRVHCIVLTFPRRWSSAAEAPRSLRSSGAPLRNLSCASRPPFFSFVPLLGRFLGRSRLGPPSAPRNETLHISLIFMVISPRGRPPFAPRAMPLFVLASFFLSSFNSFLFQSFFLSFFIYFDQPVPTGERFLLTHSHGKLIIHPGSHETWTNPGTRDRRAKRTNAFSVRWEMKQSEKQQNKPIHRY